MAGGDFTCFRVRSVLSRLDNLNTLARLARNPKCDNLTLLFLLLLSETIPYTHTSMDSNIMVRHEHYSGAK
jgi:hypothetical protein